MSLIHCPACAHQVSVSAKQCVSCGHPLRATGSSSKFLGIGLAALMTLTVGVGIYRIAPAATESFVAELSSIYKNSAAKSTPQDSWASTHTVINRLSSKDLHKELTAYSMRVNRLTPYKPNPMVTLHQVAYQSRPVHLTYEYELNAMTSKQPVDFKAIAPILQRRYCTDPEFELAAANKVPVTWEYFDDGRLIYKKTVGQCGAPV